MEVKTETVNTNLPAVEDKTVTVVPPAEDYEAILAKKDEEIANWKAAALKFKEKAKQGVPNETEDERIQRIVDERLADSQLSKANADKDALIAKMTKDFKELKLAHLNKPGVPVATGSHTESKPVQDTLITAEQLATFKAKGWSDQDIERYKKNFLKNSR